MANPEHVAKLKEGVEAWNAWRKENFDIKPDLSEADLSEIEFPKADFYQTDFRNSDLSGSYLWGGWFDKANLSGANLSGANLATATLSRSDLSNAILFRVNFYGASFSRANLTSAIFTVCTLDKVNFTSADLRETDFGGSVFLETIFADINLKQVKGLDTCRYLGPSIVDHRTILKSGKLPFVFLKGCGLPDRLIEYYPSVLNENPIQFYSCFISYSTKDQKFAERLHADLQAKDVPCWFAPHDLKTGDEIRERIDEVIRIHDKLLVIFSENSINSEWVKDEVNTAFEEEGKREEQGRKDKVLFPIRLDDSVLDVNAGWARKSRDRLIADFTNWKDHDSYTKAFDRLLKDLKAS